MTAPTAEERAKAEWMPFFRVSTITGTQRSLLTAGPDIVLVSEMPSDKAKRLAQILNDILVKRVQTHAEAVRTEEREFWHEFLLTALGPDDLAEAAIALLQGAGLLGSDADLHMNCEDV